MAKAKTLTPEQDYFVYRLAQKNDASMMKYFGANAKDYPPYVSMPAVDEINYRYPDGTLGKRQIAYVKGIKILFTDEYEANKIPFDIVKRARSIPISDGEIKITKFDKTLKQYCDITNYNGKNQDRDSSKPIYIVPVIEEDDAVDELKSFQKRKDAMNYVDSLMDKEDELIALAKFLDIPMISRQTGAKRSPSVIFKDLTKIAEKTPQNILDLKDNPVVNMAFLIKLAIEKEIIKHDHSNGNITWSNGKHITRIEKDKEFNEQITKFCFSDEGTDFVVALKGALK